MKAYIGMFRSETKRMFTIQYFFKSALFMLILLSISVMTYFNQYGIEYSTLYVVFEKITLGGFFLELIYIPASLFATQNLCMDIRQKSYYLYSSRSGKAAYIMAKIVVGVLFAFFITEVVLNIVLGIGECCMDVVDCEWYTGGADIYEDLLKNNTFLYFQMRIFFISLSSGLFTALGMLITVIVPNKYVAIVSAYMTAIILQKIELIIQVPGNVSIEMIIGGFVRAGNSIVGSVLYIFLFFMVCNVFLIYVFYKSMKRRCYGEKK